MSNYTQALTLPTLPIDGDYITASSVTNITHNTNGIKDITAKVANSLRTEVNTTTYTIQPNQDVFVYVTNNTGNVTLTLPPAITQTKDITIKKNVNNAFTVTLQRAGSDTIENPSNPLTTPTATSITPIVSSGQSITLTPVGSVWWIKNLDVPRIFARVNKTNAQILSSGNWNKIQFNNELADPLNLFDNSTNYRFTAPITGNYFVSSTMETTGASSDVLIGLRVNGGDNRWGTRLTSADTVELHLSTSSVGLSAGDYMEIFVYSNITTRVTGMAGYNSWAVFGFQSF